MLKRLIHHLQCQFARAHLDRFIRRELNIPTRRYVGQHLDHCEACWAEYERARRISSELNTHLGLLGRPPAPKLEEGWRGVSQRLMQETTEVTFSVNWSLRLTIATLLLCAFILLPLVSIGSTVEASVQVPTQPAAQQFSYLDSTATPLNAGESAAQAFATIAQSTPQALLQNTPAFATSSR